MGRQLVFASDPQPGEMPLPPDALRTFRASPPTEYVPAKRLLPAHPDIAEEISREEKEMRERWVGANGYHVTIRFTPDYPKAGWIVFNAISAPVRAGQRLG